ncbi:MAG: flagellar export chaperone FliS [Syntrophomonas sp.]|uniref:flagellar export chaperone FliS n=1 Tax=Syntrophomonas sp. TaxID=2053627 RepID=UPI00261D111D|nr:flagellar export chaperone FliS [Syntrophomonas sp.]MDD2511039.1 flagellar export chaperone FliS [Syntrophomonas sp.]MDD3880281.1 flagellar export chaperone FliS [Syntrophomonas sp.]MDD4627087.1 flagellar export chaperone FliS [Syntrophomonas sp.]
MSVNAQAYNQYKKSVVETVAPEKLLLMLYDGAIKNISNAKKAIEDKDINRAHQQIMRAEEIIVELMSTLNMEYEISGRLFALYEYFYHRLTQANAHKEIGILDEVEGFLLELRGTWHEAIKGLKMAPAQEPKVDSLPVSTVAPAGIMSEKPVNPIAANVAKGINITG